MTFFTGIGPIDADERLTRSRRGNFMPPVLVVMHSDGCLLIVDGFSHDQLGDDTISQFLRPRR